jgi:MFS family permease
VVGVVATVVQGSLLGPLVQRFGEGRLSLGGLGLVITGCLLIPLATAANAVAVVFTALGLLAFGTGLVTPCLRSQVSRRLDDGGQGAALGSLQGLQSLGGFIGPPLAGLAYDLVGRTSPFWGGISLFLVVGLLVSSGPGEKRSGEPWPSPSRGPAVKPGGDGGHHPLIATFAESGPTHGSGDE